jgi:hypothetical protein
VNPDLLSSSLASTHTSPKSSYVKTEHENSLHNLASRVFPSDNKLSERNPKPSQVDNSLSKFYSSSKKSLLIKEKKVRTIDGLVDFIKADKRPRIIIPEGELFKSNSFVQTTLKLNFLLFREKGLLCFGNITHR